MDGRQSTRAERGGLVAILFLFASIAISSVWISIRKSPSASPDADWAATPEFRVDINSATAAEIRLLPGVGPELASRIIEHRNQIQAYRSLDDLLQVHGVGPSRLKQISPHINLDRRDDTQNLASQF
jgi:competence protein ComEA